MMSASALLHMFGRRMKAFSPRRSGRSEAGYSLLEIMVVVAIMALLATIVAPRLLGFVGRSEVTAARAQIQSLHTALDTYRLDMGRYPTTQEGLAALVAAPENVELRARWFGPYLEGEVPLDPWGQSFVYENGGRNEDGTLSQPRVVSLGADGVEGGEGLNADITARAGQS